MSKPMRELREGPAEQPFRPVRLGPRDYILDRRPDGTIHIRSPHPLAPYATKITERLEHWADRAPERTFIAQRDARGEWRRVSYAEALQAARAIGEALLKRDVSPERPVAILSGNDIEHALLGLGALFAGVPYVPISPAFSLISEDFGKLKHVLQLLTPGLIFVADGQAFERALATAVPAELEVVVTRNPPAGRSSTLFAGLLATRPTQAIDAAHARVGPDTISKILFTSGSTGMPKGVINTQRMWCSNQEMIRNQLAFFQDEPPVILEWAPWHHTAGGNHNFGFVLYNGGTFYIDEGKPAPGAIEITVKNLREISTTWYFTVPKGYEALLPFFRNDAALRRTFFDRLKVLWFAGAALAQSTYDEMQELAYATVGERILFLTGLGATETAPMALARMWHGKDSTNMGLPVPGVELKLVPLDGKLDARLRGPNITPGYWRQPELTAKAFDEDGFYRLGDALRFEDPDDPGKGLLFDGRTAEDFKLSSGTWVSVGPLRARFLAHLEPYVRDVVIAGADRDEIAALIFPDVEACRRLAGAADDEAAENFLAHPRVMAEFRDRLNSFAKTSTGGSTRICRAMLLAELPSLDTGEATDKGSINQRAVLARRVKLVEEIYAKTPTARVLVIDKKV